MVGPHFATLGNAVRDHPFGPRRIGDHDDATQRIAGAHGLHIGKDGGRVGGRPRARWHHAVEADHRRGREAALPRVVGERGRQRAIPGIMRSAPSNRFACVVTPLHAIGEKPDGAHAADGEHERRDQHAQLSGAPIAAEHAQGESERDHFRGCLTR